MSFAHNVCGYAYDLFQGTGLVKIIHYIGAALLFFFANLYGVVDTYIGARVNVGHIMPVRFSLFVLSTCCMLVSILGSQYPMAGHISQLWWTPADQQK